MEKFQIAQFPAGQHPSGTPPVSEMLFPASCGAAVSTPSCTISCPPPSPQLTGKALSAERLPRPSFFFFASDCSLVPSSSQCLASSDHRKWYVSRRCFLAPRQCRTWRAEAWLWGGFSGFRLHKLWFRSTQPMAAVEAGCTHNYLFCLHTVNIL